MSDVLTFCRRMFKVGCIGFGGGNALVPVLEAEFLPEDASEEERSAYDRDVVVANLTPGALPVEISCSLGRRSLGRGGMVLGAVMMALPGTLIALLLFALLSSAEGAVLGQIKTASVGVSAFIICVLTEYILNTMRSCARESATRFRRAVFVMLAVCFFVCGGNLVKLTGADWTPIFGVSTITLLLAAFFVVFFTRSRQDFPRLMVAGALCMICFLGHGKAGVLSGTPLLKAAEAVMLVLAVYGGAVSLWSCRPLRPVDGRGLRRDILVWVLFLIALTVPGLLMARETLLLVGRGFLSSLMSFGGGDAYLTIAEGLFVDSGMIPAEQYYTAVIPIVNVLPGSILCKTMTGVGYYVGLAQGGSVAAGLLMGAAGFACSVTGSCLAFLVIYYLYDSLADFEIFVILGRWIRPIVAGLLVNVMLSLLTQNLQLTTYTGTAKPLIIGFTLVLAGLNMLLRQRWRWKSVLLLLMNLAAAFAFL